MTRLAALCRRLWYWWPVWAPCAFGVTFLVAAVVEVTQ